MRDFDPHRVASEWHSGQGSALYAYMSTGRIPNEDFKERLVGEIEQSMAHADDEALDELEYLLMSVEEQEPERLGMREADEECKCGKPGCDCNECSECAGMREGDKECKCGPDCDCDECNECGMSEADEQCECGETKREGVCPYCSMQESKLTLADAIRQIVAEMKLGVAGNNPYGWGGGTHIDDDVAHHLLTKKEKEKAPEKKSGAKKKGVRKSKKAG